MKMKSPYLDSQMAEFYAKASARHQFERPAEDLVKWLKLAEGERILDVGSGSGAVATAAWRAVGSSGSVIALDESIEMLKQQQDNARIRTIACAPDVPFVDDVFDAVTAGFVISHFQNYSAVLAEIIRVLRPGGILGVTSWGSGTTQVSELWKSTMRKYVDLEAVQNEFNRIIPWDEFFSDRTHMVEVFQIAGFVDVKTDTKEYLIYIDPLHYVDTKIGSIEGTMVRNTLNEEGWKQFLKQLLFSIQEHFPDGIEYTRNVHFVSGRKPI